MKVAEFPARRAGEQIADEARVCRLPPVGVVDEIAERFRLRRSRHQIGAAKERAVADHPRDSLQERVVRHAVEIVDAEADRGQDGVLAERRLRCA